MQKQWNWKWIVCLKQIKLTLIWGVLLNDLFLKCEVCQKLENRILHFFMYKTVIWSCFKTCFRNVVKSFYTASLLYDVLTQFGELSDEVCDASFLWVTLKSRIINLISISLDSLLLLWTFEYTVPPPLWYDSFSNACHTFNFSCCSGLALVLQGCAPTPPDPQWQLTLFWFQTTDKKI